jgi:hypothetical protein
MYISCLSTAALQLSINNQCFAVLFPEKRPRPRQNATDIVVQKKKKKYKEELLS